MTAERTETIWQPGDPIMPDRGCGQLVTPVMSAEERAAVIGEGGLPPQWWRPEGEGHDGLASSRCCRACDVRWSGSDECWVCGGTGQP